jgi:hypothetical protein
LEIEKRISNVVFVAKLKNDKSTFTNDTVAIAHDCSVAEMI